MILVFGGAYQGKSSFVEEKFGVKKDMMYHCSDKNGLCFDSKVINNLDAYILGAVGRNENPISYIVRNLENLRDKIIVCDDVSCGIVPLGKDLRLFRDNAGKILQILSREADEVYRVFCGLGERLK